ncbi:hypothetical protein ABZ388_11765 [Micromonospora parva]|uniref:hypothetical protein n=1 Tax=Micromonospora parva TaxID=1464048 RepID=UPI0033CD7ABB
MAILTAELQGDPLAEGHHRVHLLQPEARATARRVGQVVIANLVEAQQRPPERQHIKADERVESDLNLSPHWQRAGLCRPNKSHTICVSSR